MSFYDACYIAASGNHGLTLVSNDSKILKHGSALSFNEFRECVLQAVTILKEQVSGSSIDMMLGASLDATLPTHAITHRSHILVARRNLDAKSERNQSLGFMRIGVAIMGFGVKL